MTQKKLKSRFIAGWEIDFADPDELSKILMIQAVDKTSAFFFSEVQTTTELRINKDKIVQIIKHSKNSIESKKSNYRLPIIDWIDRKVFFLTKNQSGRHRVGGERPSRFSLPDCNKLGTPFIYIATIDTSDKKFDWIDMPKLNIAYPLYECKS